MQNYIGLIHKDADSDYGVSFPDFPGCVTAGVTLDEARALAQEALALCIEGMIEDEDAIPEPSSLEAIMADPDNRDAVAVLAPPIGLDGDIEVRPLLGNAEADNDHVGGGDDVDPLAQRRLS